MRNNLRDVLCGKLKDGEEIMFLYQANINRTIRKLERLCFGEKMKTQHKNIDNINFKTSYRSILRLIHVPVDESVC